MGLGLATTTGETTVSQLDSSLGTKTPIPATTDDIIKSPAVGSPQYHEKGASDQGKDDNPALGSDNNADVGKTT